MNYYLDTEFLEGTQRKRFLGIAYGNTVPTIDLISIGIVSDDGREYYAISKDFNLKEAWNRFDLKNKRVSDDNFIEVKEYWIRENVLKPIWIELYIMDNDCFLNKKEIGYLNKKSFNCREVLENHLYNFTYLSFEYLINKYGKSNKHISLEIEDFVLNKECENWLNKTNNSPYYIWDDEKLKRNITDVNFYTYYGDYDWVVFCWLFGRMIDLPKGFPMYARDLKQILDSKELIWEEKTLHQKTSFLKKRNIHIKIESIKDLPSYPIQSSEHNALDDARWNKKFYEFLNKL